MEKHAIQQTIEAYINAYNAFDVAGMLATLHPSVQFKNVVNGKVTLATQGMEAFRAQAEQATGFFRQRTQTVTDLRITGQEAEAAIDYRGVLAVDLPNGLKAGDTLALRGKSIFRFHDNLISSLDDIS